jgi:hypothetical protein
VPQPGIDPLPADLDRLFTAHIHADEMPLILFYVQEFIVLIHLEGCPNGFTPFATKNLSVHFTPIHILVVILDFVSTN